MPHAKRWSTPIMPIYAEEALVIGYWLGTRKKGIARVCEKHLKIIAALDEENEARTAPTPPPPPVEQLPTTNGNINTAPPPPADASPPRVKQTVISYGNWAPPIESQPMAQPTPFRISQEQFEQEPPKQPAMYCPLCGKGIEKGEVHAC